MANTKQNNSAEDKDKNQSPEIPPSEPPPPEKPVPMPKKVHAVCMRDCMAVVDGSGECRFVRQGERVQIMTDAPGFCHFTELGNVQA